MDCWLTEKQMIIFASMKDRWNIDESVKGDRIDWLSWNITLWLRKKPVGCSYRMWSSMGFVCVCVCVCVWKCEPDSIRVWVSIVQKVSWEGSSSQFTLSLSSVNHSRRLEDIKGRCVKVISSCRLPQGGGSAKLQGWREERLFSLAGDFIQARLVQICKIAFGTRDTILSLMQGPFFLPHAG